MDYRHNANPRIHAKKVWYIDGKGFESDNGTKNGADKAKQYCFEHMLNTNDIIVFDSRTEYHRYLFLKERERKGEVENISIHQRFPLISGFEGAGGAYHEPLEYEADFVYFDKLRNKRVVEDVKGSKFSIEEVFYVKWKVFDLRYKSQGLGIEVTMPKRASDYMTADCWYSIDDTTAIKAEKGIKAKRNAEQLKQMKAQAHEAEIKARKLEKTKAMYLHLKSKEKPTKAENERLARYEEFLKANGVLL